MNKKYVRLKKSWLCGLLNPATEIWKDIVDYEGVYQISNLGKVKSLYRLRQCSKGAFRVIPERVLKSKISRGGYETVHLRTGKESWPSVHRLVASAFIPNLENKPTVNHIDGIKLNNNLTNLEWATESEQMIHAISTGLYTPPVIKDYTRYGEDAHSCKIKQEDVEIIKSMRKQGRTYKYISEQFNIGISQTFRICKNQSWNWLT